MTATSATPADTTMMRIVHDALRRDVLRALVVLGQAEATADRRRAIAAHLTWMVEFIRAHHASEDDGIYPLARRRADGDGAALAVLDRMAMQHAAMTPALHAVDDASVRLGRDPSDDAARAAVSAVEELSRVLLPHLDAEESEAMPIVSRLVTTAEWDAIEHEHNLDHKSPSQLGFEGHWLIDGAPEQDRATVVGLVPPVQRFVLLHIFGRRYRRHAAACWATTEAPPRRVQLANSVSVTSGANIEAVWDVVRDVTRVGEWSHECVAVTWLGGATEAKPGARFRGRNRAGIFRWGRECEVVLAEPYQLVWRTVPTAFYPDSSVWQIVLDVVDGGTQITQSFEVVKVPKVLGVLYGVLIKGHRDRTAALAEDLHRLGRVAERTSLTAGG